VGKRQLYTKGETIHRTIPKHRVLKIENNVQNKKATILLHTQYFAGDKIEMNEMGWTCGAYG
jgi:hypothetical protein